MKFLSQKPLSKKLLTHIAGYSVLQFLGPAMTLILTPLYLRFLTIEAFASLSLLWLLGLLVANLANAKLDQALRAFFFDFSEHQTQEKERYFGQIFSVSFAIALVLVMFFGLFSESLFVLIFNERYAFVAPLAPMIVSIAILNQFANTAFVWQQNQEQLKRYSMFKVVPLVINFTLQLMALLVWDMGITGVVMAHLVSSSFLFVAILMTYRQHLTVNINWPELLPSLKFALPLLVFALLYYLDRNLDRMVVEKLLDAEHLAAFALWASLVSMVHLLLNALDTAIRPQLFANFKRFKQSHFSSDRGFFSLYFATGFLAIISLWPVICGIVMLSGKAEYQAISSVALIAVLSTLPLLIIRFFGLYYVFSKETSSLTALYGAKVFISALLLWYSTSLNQLVGTFAAIALSQLLIIFCMVKQFPDFSVFYLRSLHPLWLLNIYLLGVFALTYFEPNTLVTASLSVLMALAFVIIKWKQFLPDDNRFIEATARQSER